MITVTIKPESEAELRLCKATATVLLHNLLEDFGKDSVVKLYDKKISGEKYRKDHEDKVNAIIILNEVQR